MQLLLYYHYYYESLIQVQVLFIQPCMLKKHIKYLKRNQQLIFLFVKVQIMIKPIKLKLENHGILYITVHTRNAWFEL